ncbi:MAG: hypothetical protein ACWA40_10345 [Planktomarina sp.]
MTVPNPTPQLMQSLSPSERNDHKARIGVEVEIVLDGYWQSRPGLQMKAAILADWMDTLCDWHVDQVRWALRTWRNDNPNRKPNPGHILAVLKEQRGKTWVAQRDGQPFVPEFAIGRRRLALSA